MDDTRLGRSLLSLLLLLGAALVAGPARAAEDPARIWRVCVTDSTAPPFLYNDAKRPGLIERLMADAGRQVGLSMLFLRYPARRCRVMMEEENLDAFVGAATALNMASYQFPMKAGAVDSSRRLAHLNLVWIKRSESPYQWDGKQLGTMPNHSLLIGTRASISVVQEPLEEAGFKVDAAALSTQQSFAKLVAKRVDAVVALQEETEALLHDPAFSSLVVLPRAFASRDFYAVVRRKLPPELQEQVNAWWAAIARLREMPAYKVN